MYVCSVISCIVLESLRLRSVQNFISIMLALNKIRQ